LPVIKHIPGHGRALVDSHKELPRVDVSRETLEAEDFKPFKALSYAPFAMTAHIIYEDIDSENEATFSKKIISEVIRKDIGFEGLLMSDDLGMNALSFDYATRAQKTFDAGVDLGLHCSGIIEEMREIASVTPPMTNENYNKLNKYLALTNTTIDFEKDRAEAEYNKLVK
jgi:beta-N-acetylhexosaminidase